MNTTMSGERRGKVVVPRSQMGRELPVVIRPRPLTLSTWEELIRSHPGFGRRLAAQPEQLRAMARAILRNDEPARERFGDEETLVHYLRSGIAR